MNDAALFFLSHYIVWIVGMLDPDLTEELDGLTPPGIENWRQVMRRQGKISEREVRARFLRLCETMSDETAVEAILMEFAPLHVDAEVPSERIPTK